MDNVWYKATSREAEFHKEVIVSQMGEWFIAELVDGQIKGSGYGGILTKKVSRKIGSFAGYEGQKRKFK